MYQPKYPIRIVTAASLFDGHDASINMIRRLLQDAGCEVIHLGHNRSVKDVVTAVLQESAQGVCISSYQGGHMEYFKYMRDLLDQAGASYVQIFGGGGGVIVYDEKRELEAYGIAQIFHPDDGRRLGLEGMIELIQRRCDFDIVSEASEFSAEHSARMPLDLSIPHRDFGLAITDVETQNRMEASGFLPRVSERKDHPLARFIRPPQEPVPPVLGVTGTGGAGKSSLVDELVLRFVHYFPGIRIGIVCVDPTKAKTGGALLGDRIRMNSLSRSGLFMRSLASRGSGSEIAASLPEVLQLYKQMKFDFIIAETSGIGQASSAIASLADLSLYVMTSEFGAQSQLEKIDMIDFADLIAINKADHRGSLDALRDVRKQFRRTRKLFAVGDISDDELPVFLTQAAQFNDGGVNQLFRRLVQLLSQKASANQHFSASHLQKLQAEFLRQRDASRVAIVKPERAAYLSEIAAQVRSYKQETEELAQAASQLGALELVGRMGVGGLSDKQKKLQDNLSQRAPTDWQQLQAWPELQKRYQQDHLQYEVRGRVIEQPLTFTSLSGLKLSRVVFPKISDWGDRLRFLRLENLPGFFPFTAGVFPLKRDSEDPRRQFAGEGTPERTNKRFHYLSRNDEAKRLSTAFDSVTLYGFDPNERPDIFGKVGESGVSICTLDDMKKLFAGFDLCSPATSVSMTINGPAPMILAFFMNTAIDQQVEKKQKELGRALTEEEHGEITAWTLSQVRGTVQADILKEDQGQNTCIFSIDFALKLMGDIQEYFVAHSIRNFYSVSISGYHIAEAGANPISQLAFTLSNAFTFVEYYLARGMKIDDFAGNLSFFFSNGLDPEYAVIGRVARRIWAIALRDVYHASERSQKLKYHIQTSGRSLHAQEIDFNDIRTTLQALLAINDNCNSLHTNAYDEAITTPTEESVRRAMAIQMIINREFGLAKNENPNQGSFILAELTDLVEEAVLAEFDRLNERGGVLGAMETQYQRSKIQDESMLYERLKHSGELPIIGVNTFVDPKTLEASYVPPKIELARASYDEKNHQLSGLHQYQKRHQPEAILALERLKSAALANQNVFSELMRAARVCSLHQMTEALFEVGGEYRRNL